MDSASPSIVLPAFGSLCANIARKIGLPRHALASKAQRAWARQARATIDAMGQGGAPMERLVFALYDDRAAMAWLDRKFDGTGGDEQFSFCEPTEVGKAAFRFESLLQPGGEPLFHRVYESIVAVRLGEQDRDFWNDILKYFGNPSHAMAFVLGHEAAHAIFSNAHWEPIANALMECSTALGGSAGARVQEFALDLQPDSAEPERLLAMAVEEAMCDAVGAWAAARAGCEGAFERASALRSSLVGQSHRAYDTSWMLDELGPGAAGLDFKQLLGAIEKACQIHGPAVSGRFEPPKLSVKLEARRQSHQPPLGSIRPGPA